jgi:hypothetical protein
MVRMVATIAAVSISSGSVKPRQSGAAGLPIAAPVANVTGAVRHLLLWSRLRIANGDQRLQLQEALLADALDVHQLLDIFWEDSRLNVYGVARDAPSRCAHQRGVLTERLQPIRFRFWQPGPGSNQEPSGQQPERRR